MRKLPALLALGAALLAAACRSAPTPGEEPGRRSGEPPATPATPAPATPAASAVLPGLEVLLRDSLHLVRGRRVGFVTNQTAITRSGESGIDLLARHPGVQVVALYGPEHGLRGGVEGGVKIESGRDEKTGIPVFSLYGKTQKPTAEMLRGVEVLLFDMQDIGARPYTFVWTMVMAMEAAAAQRIPFVVLDRPNPITTRSEGPLMREEIRRERIGQPITGYYPVPLRHGMTAGEIARYVNGEYRIGADLHVVPAAGWRGGQWFDATGLPWVNPSPNIRSLEAALSYSGLVLLEATNLSVGRGTEAPFSYVGAPWLDADALLQRLRGYEMPGVELSATRFTPRGQGWILYRDSAVNAVRLRVTDRGAYRPAWTALVLLSEIRRQHPTRFRVSDSAGFTQMLGSREARTAFDRGTDPREIWRQWEEELRAWMPVRERYRMY